MRLRSLLRAGIAVASLGAFAGIVVNAQTAAPAPGAAAPADQPVTYVKPLFTEDFESGKIDPAIWTPATAPARGGGAPRGGPGAGGPGAGGPGAAATPAGGPGTGGAAAGGAPATNPSTNPAAPGGRRGGGRRGGARGPAGPTIITVMEIVQDKVANGKHALHVHIPANATSNSYNFLTMKLPAAVKSHLFGRVNMMITPELGPSHANLFFAGTDGWPKANWLELGHAHGQDQPSLQQKDPAPGDRNYEVTKRGAVFPTGKWFCIEWEFNDHPDSINIWIDGKPADSFTFNHNGVDTDLVKGFTSFGIGAQYWGSIEADTDIYYDDLAIGTGRIGPVK